MITILHVDDDPVDHELTRIKLHRLERELVFHPAESADLAVRNLRENRFDCILSDFQMPGKTGLEFLREVRALGDDTPFIFLTGQGNEQVAAEALRSGANDYFTKTEGFAHYDRLLNAIRNVVRAHRLALQRQQAENKFRAVFDNSIAGIYQTMLDGTLILANPAILRMFGYERLEEIGTAVALYCDPADREKIIENIRRDGMGLAENIRFRRRDGSIMYGTVFAHLRDNILHGTIIDTTEKHLAAMELQASQAKYQRIVETANEGIVTYDVNGIITFANSRLCELLGYPIEEVVGARVRDFLFEDDWDEHEERHREMQQGTGQRQTFERRFRHRDGGTRWFLVSISAQPEADGSVREILGLLTDITERREAEEALRVSEKRVRAKLDAILTPAGDIGELGMADIFDVPAIQALMDDFYLLTQMPVSFIDLAGVVHVGTGWQHICTRFHRVNPETNRNCIECDTVLSQKVEPGTYKIYECLNGLWDVVTPITVGGRHVGNLFTGQFFFEDAPPDVEQFRKQARRYGFDEEAYLAALAEAPVFSREHVAHAMSFYIKLADAIGKLSYSNLKLARTAEALRESENRANTILESAPNPILLMRDMRYIWVNPEAVALLGYTAADEIVGRPINEFIAPDCIDEIRERYARIVEGNANPPMRLAFVRPDGTRVVAEANSAPIILEDGLATLVMGIDITDRLRIEQNLRDSEYRYRTLFEQAPVGIFSTTSDGTALVANPEMARILGFDDVEKALEHYADLARDMYVQPGRRAEFIALMKEKGSVEDFEYEARAADGRHVWIGMNARISERLPDGRFIIEGFATDITERKRATDALEKRILALTRPLEEADGIEFEELFNLDHIQQLQDEFAAATGVSSIITRPDGQPITGGSRSTRLCMSIIRATEKGEANCQRSDAYFGRFLPDGPLVQPCLSCGLWTSGASISVGGRHIANWIIGQVRNEAQNEEDIRAYAREIGADEEAAVAAFREVPVMSREQFEAVSQALFTIASQISDAAFQNMQQARSITELKVAQEELRQRELQYRAAVETTADGFLVADAEGNILEVNDSLVRMLGYSREELLTMRIPDLEAAEDLDRVKEHLAEIIAGGNEIFETRHRRKDGSVLELEVNASYWPIRGGRFFSFMRDIRRRKQSETILRTRLRLIDMAAKATIDQLMQETLDAAELLTGSSIGFFHFIDPDQENLTLNAWSSNTVRTMCTAQGHGKHYPISSAGVWVDGFHSRAPVIHNDYTSLPHRKGMPEGHAPVVRELTVPVIHKDLVVAILGVGNKGEDYSQEDVEIVQNLASIAMDVIENKRRDLLLQLQSQALEAAANGIVLTDRAGVIQWVNEAFSVMTGYSREETLGRDPSLLKSGKHTDSFYRVMWETIQRGEPWSGEVVNRRKDGSQFTEEMTITPVMDEAGVISHYIAIKKLVNAPEVLHET